MDGWFARCTRRVCLMGQSEPGFFVEHDFWTADQIDSNPIYRDFFRPHGLGWSAGTGLRMPTGDNIVFSVEREFSRGPIEKERVNRLNELRPHLARSAFVTARLGLQRAKGAGETLTSMGLPALLLDEGGAVLEANHLMEALSDHVQWRARDRIALTDGRANELLWASLAALDTAPELPVRSFPLRDGDNTATMVVHIIPIRRSAHDIFTRSYALLVVTPVATPRAPPVELVRSLFDLTAVRSAGRSRLGDGRDAGGDCRNRRRRHQHRPHPVAPGDGKDRMYPSGRGRGAAGEPHARSRQHDKLGFRPRHIFNERPGNRERTSSGLICLEDDASIHRHHYRRDNLSPALGERRQQTPKASLQGLERFWKGNADEAHVETGDRPVARCRGYFTDPWRWPGERLPLHIAGQGQGLQVLNCRKCWPWQFR